MKPAGWENILEDDETIIWQGRPDTGMHLKPYELMMMAFGFGSTGLGIYWLVVVPHSEGLIWVIGLIFLALGPAIIWRSLKFGRYERANTWYTLTNRRAIISSDIMLRGATLESYVINADTELEYKPGALATINFGEKTWYRYKGQPHIIKVGFEFIKNGEEAYQLMLDLQKKGGGDAVY